ncbi:uncharacterized protein [Diabrotica undecimpunctata]|uniref:uncharacterized protein n=1 Tax=Diabrotica undecimpunctata TaxID=50387 RepID=UPI003B635597
MIAVSYIPKKGKHVIAVSTVHRDDRIDEDTGDQKKPEIITVYNSTKSGVDVVDKMITSYNVSRNTKRWPMVVVYNLLNLAAINEFKIYKGNNTDKEFSKTRRLFQKNLGMELV